MRRKATICPETGTWREIASSPQGDPRLFSSSGRWRSSELPSSFESKRDLSLSRVLCHLSVTADGKIKHWKSKNGRRFSPSSFRTDRFWIACPSKKASASRLRQAPLLFAGCKKPRIVRNEPFSKKRTKRCFSCDTPLEILALPIRPLWHRLIA